MAVQVLEGGQLDGAPIPAVVGGGLAQHDCRRALEHRPHAVGTCAASPRPGSLLMVHIRRGSLVTLSTLPCVPCDRCRAAACGSESRALAGGCVPPGSHSPGRRCPWGAHAPLDRGSRTGHAPSERPHSSTRYCATTRMLRSTLLRRRRSIRARPAGVTRQDTAVAITSSTAPPGTPHTSRRNSSALSSCAGGAHRTSPSAAALCASPEGSSAPETPPEASGEGRLPVPPQGTPAAPRAKQGSGTARGGGREAVRRARARSRGRTACARPGGGSSGYAGSFLGPQGKGVRLKGAGGAAGGAAMACKSGSLGVSQSAGVARRPPSAHR